MRGAIYEKFRGPITVQSVAEPEVPDDGVLIEVQATGICRSDWFGWQGHDADIKLPHVPGHEFAGIILETGSLVSHWKAGDRVTAPFVCGCGTCGYCHGGNPQVCPKQTQPGFTHWGAFAQYVVVRHADLNLVALPDELPMTHAAVLGCRYGTAYRAIVQQAILRPGEHIAVFGCGGLGQAAIQISHATGARVIAIDVRDSNLQRASSLGASHTINSKTDGDVVSKIQELTNGGCHVTIDAIGHREVVDTAVLSLRRQGRHIQAGLLEGVETQTGVHLDRVLAFEIHVIGSHGIAAATYPEMFKFIRRHRIDLKDLLDRTCTLEEGVEILMQMDVHPPEGVCVIEGIGG